MSSTLDDDSLLAGEYVLGVLDSATMRAVERRAGAEPTLAGEIASWERRLAPLSLLVPAVTPPAELWTRISRSIASPTAAVVPAVANDNRAALRRWRLATAASLAVAACLAVAAILPRLHPAAPPAALEIAALTSLSGPAPAFIARTLPDGQVQIAAVSPAAVPADRDLQLWALPAGATRPVSLGVLPRSGRIIQASVLVQPGGKLLVSLEPKGGSPTGLPTGPVLYGGTIALL